MIKMRKITRKVIALASAFAMTLPMFSTTAFAKELPVAEVTTASSDNNGILPRVSWVSVGTYGAGEYQMEYVNFKDKTNGAIEPITLSICGLNQHGKLLTVQLQK